MKPIRCLGIFALVGAALATTGCGRVVMADPPENAATVVNHNLSTYFYSPGLDLSAMPWIALTPDHPLPRADIAPKGAIVRYNNILRGDSAGVSNAGDATTQDYDVFYGSAWFGELRANTPYLALADRTASKLASNSMAFYTLPGEIRRGALKGATPLEQKTVAQARTAVHDAVTSALGPRDYLGAYIKEMVKSAFDTFYDEAKATHGVKIETIRFTSVSPSGQPIEVSALLAYPDDLSSQQTPPPLVSYQHYSDGGDKSTSEEGTVRAIATAYASRGAVFVAADTVGIGASKGQPLSYLLWANAANTYYDGILAANNRLLAVQRIAQPLSRLHLVGYSKGGFGTLALAESLENLYGTPPEKVYFGAAPLDMPRTFEAYLKRALERDAKGDWFASSLDHPALGTYIAQAILPSWGAVLKAEISVANVFDPAGHVNAAFADRYLSGTDDSNIGLKSFLEANSFTERTTYLSRFPLSKSKVRVFHYEYDPLISPENTNAFMRLAAAKGLPDVQRGSCGGKGFEELIALAGAVGIFSSSTTASSNALHALCGFSMLNASLKDL